MEIITGLGLIVIILLALNHMAGGRPGNVLGPVSGIVGGVFRFALGITMRLFGSVGRLLGGAASSAAQDAAKKIQNSNSNNNDPPSGRTPPRWD